MEEIKQSATNKSISTHKSILFQTKLEKKGNFPIY